MEISKALYVSEVVFALSCARCEGALNVAMETLFRQLMVMDETHVMNQMKEDVCYVSLDFNKDMETAKYANFTLSEYFKYKLPDISMHVITTFRMDRLFTKALGPSEYNLKGTY